jgi:hypothetical protein
LDERERPSPIQLVTRLKALDMPNVPERTGFRPAAGASGAELGAGMFPAAEVWCADFGACLFTAEGVGRIDFAAGSGKGS